jgi:hypothetical protein
MHDEKITEGIKQIIRCKHKATTSVLSYRLIQYPRFTAVPIKLKIKT